jgi:hypothetical protein
MTDSQLATFKLFLRIVGTSSLLAIFAVAMPREWMNSAHQWLGLGELPDAPIVGYLARSTSAFYALTGGLLWVISFEPRRYRKVLLYIGVAFTLLGLTLLAVDISEGLPLYWILMEGPIDTLFGLIMVYCGRRL